MSFVFAVIIGVLTGILTGAGIGGGTILVLYLTAIANVAQDSAQGVNLLYFLVSAPFALFFHLKEKRVEVRGGAIAAVFGCLSALLGAWLAGSAPPHILSTAFGALCIVIGVRELTARRED